MASAEIIEIDRMIATYAVDAFLKAGFLLGVNDGVETTLRQSRDRDAILAAMFTTDEDWLHVYRLHDEAPYGWVRLIYGNTGWDVINNDLGEPRWRDG